MGWCYEGTFQGRSSFLSMSFFWLLLLLQFIWWRIQAIWPMGFSCLYCANCIFEVLWISSKLCHLDQDAWPNSNSIPLTRKKKVSAGFCHQKAHYIWLLPFWCSDLDYSYNQWINLLMEWGYKKAIF